MNKRIAKKTREQAAPPRHDAFTTRIIERMHRAGIADSAARDRLLSGAPLVDSHAQVGYLQALLSVAVGHVEGAAPGFDEGRE